MYVYTTNLNEVCHISTQNGREKGGTAVQQ